jgi:hypothetical protein
MVASSPARKNITRRTREEMVPRSPFPNNAPAIQRRPKATMTMLMKSSTVGIYNPNGERVKIAGSMSAMAMFRQLTVLPCAVAPGDHRTSIM